MRKTALSSLSILFILSALILSSCSSDKRSDGATVKYSDTVRVAVTPTLDCLPIIIAKEAGLADARGICLLLQYHASKADCDTALLGGSVSAIFTDYVRAGNLRTDWTRLLKSRKWGRAKADSILLFPHDNLQMSLLANSKGRVSEAKQLADKMVAADRYSAEADFARVLLDSVGLRDDKSFIVNIPSLTVRRQMFSTNIMDAVVFPEPWASVARKEGHKALWSSGQVAGKPLGCVAATRDSEIILKMYNLGVHAINTTGIHSYDSVLVRCLKVPQTQVATVAKYHFVTIK